MASGILNKNALLFFGQTFLQPNAKERAAASSNISLCSREKGTSSYRVSTFNLKHYWESLKFLANYEFLNETPV